MNTKILIVDDSQVILDKTREFLEKIGYHDITEAHDGLEALSKLSDHKVILTDWNMPEMSGIDFVREVRKTRSTSNVYIIMITTESDAGGIIDALKAGVDNYMMKPFSEMDLERTLNTAFENVL